MHRASLLKVLQCIDMFKGSFQIEQQGGGGINVIVLLANSPCQRNASVPYFETASVPFAHDVRALVPSPRHRHKARCAHTLSHTLQHPSTTQSHNILFTQHTCAHARLPIAKFTKNEGLVLNLDSSHLAASTNIEFYNKSIQLR